MLNSPKGGLFAGRFELEREAGSGGTGAVYCARDHFSGDRVALKLLHSIGGSHQEAERFSREAQLLAELCHPGIVSYVAHGTTADGQCYLAMEWLEGEDLAHVLSRGPLSISDTLRVAHRVAEALSVAHRRGVVHRDLKPTNLFVVGGQIDQIKILDFGIARRALTMAAVTRSGMLVGTPAYMAPEQAHGTRQITPATDIFSLGCVLFECLSGRPPFIADHVAAVLARVLFDEPPPLASIRPDTPPALEALLLRMLNKDPVQRPADATALLAELQTRESELALQTASTTLQQPTLSVLSSRADSDQILVNVVLAAPRQQPVEAQPGGQTLTLRQSESGGPPRAPHPTLRAALTDLGVNAEWLLDGSLVVTLAAHGYATDQVARAAQVALTIKSHWPEAQVVLTTGLGAARHNMLLGNAVERAARLMRDHEGVSDRVQSRPALQPVVTIPGGSSGELRPVRESGVWVDELSSRLLERYYQLISTRDGILLTSTQQSLDDSRQVLGKATACVGREQELSTLDIVLNTCIEESSAKLVLVTAPAGFGKSRLRHEFLRRIASRGSQITVLYGRAEMISKGSAFAVLSHALRRLCGIQSDQSSEEQQALLQARIGCHIGGSSADRRRVVEFIGELCGIPFPAESSELLQAARSDPKIMKERVQRAFLDFLGAECAAAPVVLLIEDLHWGDALTVGLLEQTLRQHADQPLLLVSFARPEVHELFPRLGKVFGSQELVLKGLSKKACERLIQQVLGKHVAPVVIDTLVRLSDGNPLFLEELIRSAAEPNEPPGSAGDSSPSADASRSGTHRPYTVLAMLQARLSQLDPSARRVLRAASIFGQTFWRGGVARLLGSEADGLDRWLDHLVALEHIEKHRESRFGRDVELGFRHALWREAVYSLLTDFDRRAGHLAAAHYLLDAGETEAQTIAEHFHLGGDAQSAAEHYLRAAQHAYVQQDIDGMLRFGTLGSEGASDAVTRGTLQAILCVAHASRMDVSEAFASGESAIASLPIGSLWWCRAMQQLFVLPAHGSDETGEARTQRMDRLIERFSRARPSPDALTAYAAASAFLICYTAHLADRDHAFAFLIFLEQIAESTRESDLLLHGWTAYAQGSFCHALEADPAVALQHAQGSLRAFERAEAQQGMVNALVLCGQAHAALGQLSDAEEALRRALTMANQLRDRSLASLAQAHLAHVLSLRSEISAQKEASESCIRLLQQVSDPLLRGIAHAALARVQRLQGRSDLALATCQEAEHRSNALPLYRLALQTTRCDALVEIGDANAAAATATQALQALDDLGGAGWLDVPLRLAAASALARAGQRDMAREQLAAAETQIETRASRLADAKVRLRYLALPDENLRAQALARELGLSREKSL